ncbi:MAG: EpsG family protein [Syntrophaceae bacterium]|nr:EpsG family protein [Syntrophaceae bacterium]
MIYLIIIIYIAILSMFYEFGNLQRGKGICKLILFVILVGLSGFRYRVGGDTYYYMAMFEQLPNLSEIYSASVPFAKLQPLWILVNGIAKSIHPDFFVLQIIHALIINSVIFSFINKYTKYFFTSALLYFIGYYGYFNFEIMRESLAVCFFLLSIKSFINKRWVKYYLFVLVAFGFHYSAIVLFLLPVIKKIKVNFLSVSFIAVFGVLINDSLAGFIGKLTGESGLFLSAKHFVNYKYTLWGLLFILVYYVLYPILVLKISNTLLKIDSPLYSLLKIIILLGAFSTWFFIFYRFLNYLTPILFIFLTEVLHGFFRRKSIRPFRVVVAAIIFIVIASIHTLRYFSNTSQLGSSSKWYSRWYPYYSIFEKIEDPVREQLYIAHNER